MATDQVDIGWILFDIILTDDDNNIDDDYIMSWKQSGYFWMYGYFGWEISNEYIDLI